MATSGDGGAPYQSGGAGGKFRKRPIRRSAQATPYDRPPIAIRNNRSTLFAKLVDPASRLIYAGADRLFGVFRKQLPSIPAQQPPESNKEPMNGLQEASPNNCVGVSEPRTDEGENLASMSVASDVSDLENMLKQKTFTRSEIKHLTALLRSRTTDSDVDGDIPKLPVTTPHVLRHEASTSSPLNKHVERENLHDSISTPVANSRIFEEDVASPAELAKAYMGTLSSNVLSSAIRLGSQAPRQNTILVNNTAILPRTPITSLAPRTAGGFKGFENGQTTPRSRGRSALYSMARTPYRGPSTLSQKAIKSDYGHDVGSPSHTFSSAREHEVSVESSKMGLKRRSFVLDDIGSGSPVRRIRQKANLMQGSSLSKSRSEFNSSACQQPGATSQKLLLRNEPEPKTSKAVDESGVTRRHNLGYASVPTKSTQMASKILEQLERLSPKEKSSGSRLAGTSEKSPTKMTSNVIHGQILGSPEKVDSPKFLSGYEDNKKSGGEHHVWLSDVRGSTSQSKDKGDENGPRKFAVPRNVLSSMNGNLTAPVRDSAPNVTNTNSTLKLPVEPPQKKRAFQMSANEDSVELDDGSQVNGNVFSSLDEIKKPGTLMHGKKKISSDEPAKVIQTAALPAVNKIPGIAFKKSDDALSPKNDIGPPGGAVNKQIGFSLPTSPPSSSNTQLGTLPQSTPIVDRIVPPKEPQFFATFGTNTKNAEKVSSFTSSDKPLAFKSNTSPGAKPIGSTSLYYSVKKNDQLQFSASNNNDNDKGEKSVNMVGKSESLSSASPAMASASGIFSFGGSTNNSSITNGTPGSSPSVFVSTSSFPAGTNTNKLCTSTSSHVLSSGTTAASLPITSTTSPPSSVLSRPASVPAPIFSFGSAIGSSTSTLVSQTSVAQASETSATIDKGSTSATFSSSPFASASFATVSTGDSIFGFSSPAATSTSNDHLQGSIFSTPSGFKAMTQASTAVTQMAPFKFGTSSTSAASGSAGIPPTSGGSLFGSVPPAFSSTSSSSSSSNSAVFSSEIKSGSSTSSSTTNIFSSAFSSTPSFGLSSSVAASEVKSVNPTSNTTTNPFGSNWQAPNPSAFGSPSTVFSFGASSASMSSASSSPIVFGSSNAGTTTGSSSMFSFTAAGATSSSFPAGQAVFGNPTPVFGSVTASPSNNDQMSMEDSMAEDSTQTPTFGQSPAGKPSFVFGSATPTPSTALFQFGGQMSQPPTQNFFQVSGNGQTNQLPSQNPFQASGSAEFSAGGSFSLGSGGGDKSGRRILRVKSKNRRK